MKTHVRQFAAGTVILLLLLSALGGCAGGEAGQTAGTQESKEAGNTMQAQKDTDAGSVAKESGNTEAAGQTEQALTEAVTFTDDLGREVTVENPRKVAALIGSFADIWLLAGGEVTATVNDAWESLKLDLGEDTVNLGSITEPDVERLIASQPDFVLASVNTEADLALLDVFDQAKIPAAYFAVSDFEEYLHMLDICTQITGRRDLYEENGLKVQAHIEAAKKRADGSSPSVLFLRASSGSVKAKGSEGNVCGEMLAGLGCINIADSSDSLLEDLSMEAIIAADPAYIFVTIQGNNQEAAMKNVEEMLISNPAWASLSAVKNGNYHLLDKRLFNLKPNARWGEAYELLADILYPQSEVPQ